jgi:ATP-dependent RNA helicase DBP3
VLISSHNDRVLVEVKKRKRDTVEGTNVKSSNSNRERKNKRKKCLESPPKISAVDALNTPIAPTTTNVPSPAEIDAFLEKHSVTIHTQDSEKVIPVISFGQLDIPSELRSALTGFKEPTPVQACTWPPAMQGRDVIGIAETGRQVSYSLMHRARHLLESPHSGKTLAFGIPALCHLVALLPYHLKQKNGPTVTVLVIAPTRELAIQTHETLSALGAPFGITSVAIFGGVARDSQIRALAAAQREGRVTRIIVGTPGRILDLANDGTCDLSRYGRACLPFLIEITLEAG